MSDDSDSLGTSATPAGAAGGQLGPELQSGGGNEPDTGPAGIAGVDPDVPSQPGTDADDDRPVGEAPATPEGLPPKVPHAWARYSVLRLLVLLAVGALLYVLGLRGMALILIAFLGSGLISFFLLARARDQAAGNIERSVRRLNQRMDQKVRSEDVDEA